MLSCLIGTQQHSGAINFLRIIKSTQTNTQINKGKLYSTGQFTLLFNLGGGKKKSRPKKEMVRKSIADHIEQSAKKKLRTTKPTKTPLEERVDLKGKDVKDGQEGKA